MYKRVLYKVLEDYLDCKFIMVVIGMCWVGKIIVVKYFFKKVVYDNKVYIDFEKIEYCYIFM